MSYELQLCGMLEERLKLVEEVLGQPLKNLAEKRKQEKAVKSGQPLELTPEERQAILQSRLQQTAPQGVKRKIA
jgi:hypothetical protein